MTLPDHMDLLVLGQGTSGLDVVRWAVPHLGEAVASITVYGGATSAPSDVTRALGDAGVRFVWGTEDVEGSYDVCVASPGISEFSAFFESGRAASREIMGEPEFAYRLSPERWVGITGTNGKTTTTALTTHLLRASGMDACAVGNIGDTPTSQVANRPDGSWFVAELSSYQLATSSTLHPRVGVLLNITPDHLAWHRTHEAYALAKCRLFSHMGPDDLAIVDVEDPGAASMLAHIARDGVRVLSLGLADAGSRDAAFVRDDALIVRLDGTETPLVAISELKIAGQHNCINALAASAIALFLGAAADDVRAGLKTFAALEHRIEPVCTIDGVRFYNDSKATNTDAVEKALTAFAHDDVVLLLGGHDKGTPLDEFAAHVVASTVRAVVCYGEARGRFLQTFVDANRAGEVELAEAENMRDAVDVARRLARRGDVVLLSPACSSFDEFSGFEERGRVYKDYLTRLRDDAADKVEEQQ